MRNLFIAVYFVFSCMHSINAKEMSAQEFVSHCKNYVNFINSKFKNPIDDKMLFNMGKCQGVIETLGKTMITLCYENKTNVNISKHFTANLSNLKTLTIIKDLVKYSKNKSDLRNISAQNYAMRFISVKWPCK